MRRIGKVHARCDTCGGLAITRGSSPPSIKHEPGCRMVHSKGQLVRARRRNSLQLNTVFVDDGRTLTVRGSGLADRCPSCSIENVPVGILSDSSLFHLNPPHCEAVFPLEDAR